MVKIQLFWILLKYLHTTLSNSLCGTLGLSRRAGPNQSRYPTEHISPTAYILNTLYINQQTDLLRTTKPVDHQKRGLGSHAFTHPCRRVSFLSMCSDSCRGACFDSAGDLEVWRRWRHQVWHSLSLVWRKYGKTCFRLSSFLLSIAFPFLSYIWRPFSHCILYRLCSHAFTNPCRGASIE